MSGDGWSDADDLEDAADDALLAPHPKLTGERYRIESLLGRGGMGEVFLAWDAHLTRHVALKRLHPSTAQNQNRLARMIREAQVTARLDHPGIVPVLDLGTTPDGAVYYTMRLVQGRTLTAARQDLSTPQLLRHLAAAVQAVAFAHAHGIVHRDLKPDNVMVGAYGETQVVDWGLARPLDEGDLPPIDGDEPGDAGLTRLGSVLGTQRYLSPEAARGLPMGPADDVYALGATLVELLTGSHGSDTASWTQLSEGIVDRELVTIASLALAAPEARYPDAGALSEALQSYLEGRPVGGHVYSLRDVGRRLAERWRWPIRVGGAAILAATAGLTIAGVGVLRERDRAVAAELRERGARIAADRTLASSLAHQAVAALREGARPEASLLAAQALALADLPRARGVAMAVGAVPSPSIEQVDTPCPDQLSIGPDGWVCADDQRVWDASGTLFTGPYGDAKRTPHGTWVTNDDTTYHLPSNRGIAGNGTLYADGDRAARLLRISVDLYDAQGAFRHVEPCGDVRSHRDGAWAPQGFWVVCVDGTAVRVSVDGPELRVPMAGVHSEIDALAWTDDHLLLATGDDTIEVRELNTGTRVQVLNTPVHRIRRLHPSPDGRWLLIEGDHGGPWLWSLKESRGRMRLPRRWKGAVFQRDGRLASGRDGYTLLDPDSVVDPSSYSPAGLSMATLDPSGTQIAATAGDGFLRTWDARTGRLENEYPAYEGFVAKWAVYSPDGTELYACSSTAGPPKRFDPTTLAPLAPFAAGGFCRRLVALTGATYCYSWVHMLPYRIDVEEPTVPAPASFHDGGQNGPHVAVALDQDGRVIVLHPDAPPSDLGRYPRAGRVDITAAGDVIAVGTPEAVVLVRPDGSELARIPLAQEAQDVALSPDGTWVAAAFLDGSVNLWRREDQVLHAVLDGVHTERISSVKFGERLLITAGWDGRVHRWSLEPLERAPDPGAIAALWSLDVDQVVRDD